MVSIGRTSSRAAPCDCESPGRILQSMFRSIHTLLKSTTRSHKVLLAVWMNHYTFSDTRDNMVVSLTGSVASSNREESSTETAPRTPAGTLRGVPIFVTENEGIKTATWIEKGTAFALDIEC